MYFNGKIIARGLLAILIAFTLLNLLWQAGVK